MQDVNSAIAVHNNMQGAIVTSSDRGGMRLQYPFIAIRIINLSDCVSSACNQLIEYFFALTSAYIFKEPIWEEKRFF